MTLNATEKDRYLCHTCGGVTVYLTKDQAEEEKAEGHDVELWTEIEQRDKRASGSELK